ncbi:glutathione S-transferase family protein [Planktotalea sp.]|uniref:glutathione S-transferase family protein n=1 Tax=Planktotalea sp. TaxID=2029877 RepID=UPI00329A4E60
MPQIEPQLAELKTLQGVHLWHAPFSSCSQRVRLTLAETNRAYESHLVDLMRGEHASADYQKIHPKGLVPALIEDGALFIESVDIIQHLARDHPSLMQNVDRQVLERADEAQLDLKLLTFEFLFRSAPKQPEDSAKSFQEAHQNEWLKQFYRDFAEGFSEERIKEAVARTAAGFEYLDTLLRDDRQYFSGDTFTVADIAWLPNFHRFDLMSWPWHRTPRLMAWFERVSKRPSYQTALADWEKETALVEFAQYTKLRQNNKTSIAHVGF